MDYHHFVSFKIILWGSSTRKKRICCINKLFMLEIFLLYWAMFCWFNQIHDQQYNINSINKTYGYLKNNLCRSKIMSMLVQLILTFCWFDEIMIILMRIYLWINIQVSLFWCSNEHVSNGSFAWIEQRNM